MPKLRRAYKV